MYIRATAFFKKKKISKYINKKKNYFWRKMDPNGEAVGNTKPPPVRSKSLSKNTFTIHLDQKNVKFEWEIEKQILLKWMEYNCKFFIFSYELGKSGTTPHIQGYMEYKKKTRIIENKDWKKYHAHFEEVKGTQIENILYITKEGGEVITSDVKLVNSIKKQHEIKILKIDDFYPWQLVIKNKIEEEADDRTINWIYENEGCRGKTALCKHLCYYHNALCVGGKAADIKYAIVKYKEEKGIYPEIILIDIPRSFDTHFLNYQALEKIKNGLFFSTKYESQQVIMNSPHLFIFSNVEPELNKLSSDRWNIMKI